MGLLLVALAVRVDQQRHQAAEDGAAEPHGDHVEEVEIWSERGRRRMRDGPEVMLCHFSQVGAVIEAAIHKAIMEPLPRRPLWTGEENKYLSLCLGSVLSHCHVSLF